MSCCDGPWPPPPIPSDAEPFQASCTTNTAAAGAVLAEFFTLGSKQVFVTEIVIVTTAAAAAQLGLAFNSADGTITSSSPAIPLWQASDVSVSELGYAWSVAPTPSTDYIARVNTSASVGALYAFTFAAPLLFKTLGARTSLSIVNTSASPVGPMQVTVKWWEGPTS